MKSDARPSNLDASGTLAWRPIFLIWRATRRPGRRSNSSKFNPKTRNSGAPERNGRASEGACRKEASSSTSRRLMAKRARRSSSSKREKWRPVCASFAWVLIGAAYADGCAAGVGQPCASWLGSCAATPP